MSNHFSPGDRVVAINTDCNPLAAPKNSQLHQFCFPDGPLRKGMVYHVAAAGPSKDSNQALQITGLRVLWGSWEILWNSSRFRKIDSQASLAAHKRRQKKAAAETKHSPNT
jgi:hypothetical protein